MVKRVICPERAKQFPPVCCHGAYFTMLAWTIYISFIGVLVLMLLPREAARAARIIALLTAIAGCVVAFAGAVQQPDPGKVATIVKVPWIPALGANYFLAADGISLVLVVLTGLAAIAGILFSWNIEKRTKEFFAFYLALIGGVYGRLGGVSAYRAGFAHGGAPDTGAPFPAQAWILARGHEDPGHIAYTSGSSVVPVQGRVAMSLSSRRGASAAAGTRPPVRTWRTWRRLIPVLPVSAVLVLAACSGGAATPALPGRVSGQPPPCSANPPQEAPPAQPTTVTTIGQAYYCIFANYYAGPVLDDRVLLAAAFAGFTQELDQLAMDQPDATMPALSGA